MAQLRARAQTDPQAAERLRELENDKEGGGGRGGGSDPIAPSIEDAGACDAGTVGHEAIGHSMFGHPNGASDGNNIGLLKTGGGGKGWTPEGCEAIKRNAFANDGTFKWDPNRQTYYVQPPPDLWWDLNSGKQLFGPRNPPPPPGNPQPPRIVGDGPKRIGFDDDFFDKIQQGSDKGGGSQVAGNGKASTPKAEPGERHRQRPGSGASTLLASVNGGQNTYQGSPESPTDSRGTPHPPPPPSKGSPGKRIGFDDEAPKGQAPGTSSVGKVGRVAVDPPGDTNNAFSGSPSSPSGSGSSDLTRVGYDDNAVKGGGASGSSGTKGSSIGYDDAAPKGGYVGVTGGTDGRQQDRGGGASSFSGGYGGSGGFTVLAQPKGGTQLDGDFFTKFGPGYGEGGEDEETEIINGKVVRRRKRGPASARRVGIAEGETRPRREPRASRGGER